MWWARGQGLIILEMSAAPRRAGSLHCRKLDGSSRTRVRAQTPGPAAIPGGLISSSLKWDYPALPACIVGLVGDTNELALRHRLCCGQDAGLRSWRVVVWEPRRKATETEKVLELLGQVVCLLNLRTRGLIICGCFWLHFTGIGLGGWEKVPLVFAAEPLGSTDLNRKEQAFLFKKAVWKQVPPNAAWALAAVGAPSRQPPAECASRAMETAVL